MRKLRTQEKIMLNWDDTCIKPLVSIQCLAYNHEPYIEDALEGFLKQETDFPFEVIIHDDASTDSTADIIKKYEKKYPKIIKPFYQVENQFSQGNQRNIQKIIYLMIQGKYIAICEGDDYWTDPLKLQKQVDFLEENEEYVITYTSVEGINENGKKIKHRGGARRDLESIELQKGTPINTLTVCFRNVIKDFPPERQCSKFGDIFLWSLLGAYGKGKYLNDIGPARYRRHDGGIFSQKTKEQKATMIYLSNFALYSYYLRINHMILRDYFHEASVNSSLGIYGRFYYLKIMLKSIINGRLYYMKKIIKRLKIFPNRSSFMR